MQGQIQSRIYFQAFHRRGGGGRNNILAGSYKGNEDFQYAKLDALMKENDEILAIAVASIRTAKKNKT